MYDRYVVRILYTRRIDIVLQFELIFLNESTLGSLSLLHATHTVADCESINKYLL